MIAEVYSGDTLVRRIDLAAVTEAYEFDVLCESGKNTVLVEPGAISVSHADCPDGRCVRQGSIPPGTLPIVCLPHRLIISIEELGN